MQVKMNELRIVRIRQGDSTTQRVKHVLSSLEKDGSITMTNRHDSCQKLIAVVEKSKQELVLRDQTYHQYSKLSTKLATGGAKKRKREDEDNAREVLSLTVRLSLEPLDAKGWTYQTNGTSLESNKSK